MRTRRRFPNLRRWSFPALLGLLAAASAAAHDGDHASPAATVAAFHQALGAGDRAAVLAMLAEDAVIFESGGVEQSRAEYAAHHLGADMAFSAAVERAVVDQRAEESGEVAWVLTRTETTGTFQDRTIDARGVETMVLRRAEDGWIIAHIHWSSRSR